MQYSLDFIMFYQQSRAFNARFKEKDWTQTGKENSQLTN